MQTNFTNILKEKKLKATTTRIQLLKIIKDFGSAIPFSIIQKKLKNTDRVTLYRTIKILLKEKIIHKISVNNQDYYALSEVKQADKKKHHIHFKCNSNLCSLIKSRGIKLSPNAKILFGNNVS